MIIKFYIFLICSRISCFYHVTDWPNSHFVLSYVCLKNFVILTRDLLRNIKTFLVPIDKFHNIFHATDKQILFFLLQPDEFLDFFPMKLTEEFLNFFLQQTNKFSDFLHVTDWQILRYVLIIDWLISHYFSPWQHDKNLGFFPWPIIKFYDSFCRQLVNLVDLAFDRLAKLMISPSLSPHGFDRKILCFFSPWSTDQIMQYFPVTDHWISQCFPVTNLWIFWFFSYLRKVPIAVCCWLDNDIQQLARRFVPIVM